MEVTAGSVRGSKQLFSVWIEHSGVDASTYKTVTYICNRTNLSPSNPQRETSTRQYLQKRGRAVTPASSPSRCTRTSYPSASSTANRAMPTHRRGFCRGWSSRFEPRAARKRYRRFAQSCTRTVLHRAVTGRSVSYLVLPARTSRVATSRRPCGGASRSHPRSSARSNAPAQRLCFSLASVHARLRPLRRSDISHAHPCFV